MTVDQVIEAARLWQQKLDTKAIAEWLRLPEHVVANNMWRITRVAEVDAA